MNCQCTAATARLVVHLCGGFAVKLFPEELGIHQNGNFEFVEKAWTE